MQFLEKVARILGRQMTPEELSELVDFDRDSDGQPRRFNCTACTHGSVAVRWVIPTIRFLEHLQTTQDIWRSLDAIEVPEFGCYFLDPANKLGPPVALCGHAFPGVVKGKGEGVRFQKSCLRDLANSTRSKDFGYSFRQITDILQELRESEERRAEQRRIVQEAEAARQHAAQLQMQAQVEEQKRRKEIQAAAEAQRQARIGALAQQFANVA